MVFAGPARGSIEMVPEGTWDNFTKINGRFEQFQEFRFIGFKFFLSFCKNISQSHLMIWYHNGDNSFLDMVDCFSTTQFYHEPVRSCFIL